MAWKFWKSKARPEPAETSDTPDNEAEDVFNGPSPNPKTNLILADVALRGGSILVREGLERGLLGRRYAPDKAKRILKGRTMSEALVGTAIARLATKSVPGAILVGGGLIAKTLYDRRKGKAAKMQGEAALEIKADKSRDQDS